MTSNFEKFPEDADEDDGSPPPPPPKDWRKAVMYAAIVLVVFVFAPLVYYFAFLPANVAPPCREISSADTATIEGKIILDLRALQLKPDECVTIRP